MIIGKFDPLKGEMYQVIGGDGALLPDRRPPSDELLLSFYRDMVRIRAMDDKAFTMQRQGRLGTYPQIKGHEGIQVGAAHAMAKDDWLVPSYREGGLVHLRGLPFGEWLLFWAGNEIGSKYPEGLRILPPAVPIASQLPHAVGIGLGANIKKEKTAVLACFGDGATSEGEFHEAMNFAGVFRTPVVFLCSNNQWAISVSRQKQTASKTLAQKAIAYGFEGVMVDGMDVVAVYQGVKEAMDRARAGGGPTMIEAVTYRLCDHTTADDASLYQDPKEVEAWLRREPVARMKLCLEKRGLLTPAVEKDVEAEARAAVAEAVRVIESTPAQTPRDIFQDTFAAMPPRLVRQLKELENA